MTPNEMLDYSIREGGGTFTAKGDVMNPKTGFAVGLHKGTFMTMALEDSDLFPDAVRMLLSKYPNAFIGIWVNEGKIYLDPVGLFADEAFALAVGVRMAQKAIYDFAAKREIYL